MCGLDSAGSVHGEMTGLCVRSYEPLSSVEAENVLAGCTTGNISS
jgi:hypothetical protein